jgi:Tol biopolymer transport system component
VLDVTTGEERRIASGSAWECGPRWLADGGLLLLSDADGWFQIVRLDPSLRDRTQLTTGAREHGDPTGLYGHVALPSPDETRFVHQHIHDGVSDLVVAPLTGVVPQKRPRGRPPKNPRPGSTAAGDRWRQST